jgi:hypothetical protein
VALGVALDGGADRHVLILRHVGFVTANRQNLLA